MRIGETQTLTIDRDSPHGFFLTDGETDVLLPKNQSPVEAKIGDPLMVFIYTDSEDRLIATRRVPLAQVGEFAPLRVVSITPNGAFLDWGLDKDLFCALREQGEAMREGEVSVVRVYLDDRSLRVACSARLSRWLVKEGAGLDVGQKVKVMVYRLGRDWIDVIVDDKYRATLFPDEQVESLRVGDVRQGYVKQIREQDGRIAVSLRPQGFQAVRGESEKLLTMMRNNKGFLHLSDRSTPEEIYKRVGLSKGAFKRLIGSLYREGVIIIEADHIRLA